MGHHLIEKMWVDQLPCWYLKALQKKTVPFLQWTLQLL